MNTCIEFPGEYCLWTESTPLKTAYPPPLISRAMQTELTGYVFLASPCEAVSLCVKKARCGEVRSAPFSSSRGVCPIYCLFVVRSRLVQRLRKLPVHRVNAAHIRPAITSDTRHGLRLLGTVSDTAVIAGDCCVNDHVPSSLSPCRSDVCFWWRSLACRPSSSCTWRLTL